VSLLERFARDLDRLHLGPGPWLVAVSGGVDSMVLLDLLSRWQDRAAPDEPPAGRPDVSLLISHVDHGIDPASREVADLVARRASDLGLPVVIGNLALGPGTSETRARAARLAWLRDLMQKSGARWILTAHHADDQRETVLMRLLRGSGPAGLAGMPRKGRGLARPLLRVPAAAIRRYAADRGLMWWEDPANRDSRHLRSWLRTSLMPNLATRLPDLPERLDAARRHAARDRQAWAESLGHWPGLGYRCEDGVHSFAWAALAALPNALRSALVQALARAGGGPSGVRSVTRGLSDLAQGASGSTADLGTGWRLELAFGRLRVLRPPAIEAPAARILETPRGELPWGRWTIRWEPDVAPDTQARDGRIAWFIPGALVLRAWQPGDRLAPLGGTGHRLAARCFQDARVAASERGGWPVITAPGEAALAWIPGVCRSGLRVPTSGLPAVRVEAVSRG